MALLPGPHIERTLFQGSAHPPGHPSNTEQTLTFTQIKPSSETLPACPSASGHSGQQLDRATSVARSRKGRRDLHRNHLFGEQGGVQAQEAVRGPWEGRATSTLLLSAHPASQLCTRDKGSPDPVKGEPAKSGFCSLPVPTKGRSQLVTGKPQDEYSRR